jgi:hypothetical protein
VEILLEVMLSLKIPRVGLQSVGFQPSNNIPSTNYLLLGGS